MVTSGYTGTTDRSKKGKQFFMQMIDTGIDGSRQAVRTAVAAGIATIFQFDNGYFAASPNNAGAASGVTVYDSKNGALVLPLFILQYPNCCQIKGNAGFSAVWGSFGTSDYADDRAMASALATAAAQPNISSTPLR
jgi:hypothetical protein